jgi:hypothetical protein
MQCQLVVGTIRLHSMRAARGWWFSIVAADRWPCKAHLAETRSHPAHSAGAPRQGLNVREAHAVVLENVTTIARPPARPPSGTGNGAGFQVCVICPVLQV